MVERHDASGTIEGSLTDPVDVLAIDRAMQRRRMTGGSNGNSAGEVQQSS
jgi:hypothetical protein